MMKVGFVRRAAIALLVLSSASANAAVIYGATGGKNLSNLYAIDSETGAATSIGPIGFAVTGLAFDPNTGVLYGATSNASPVSPHALITINPATGAGTLIGDEGLGNTGVADITIDANGTLFGWSEGTDELVSINKLTGQATPIGDTGLSTYGSGLTDVDGTLFFAGEGNTDPLRTVDKATGATTVVATLNGGPGLGGDPIAALTTGDDGTLYGALNTDFGEEVGFLVTIDPVTGLITEVGPVVQGLDALAFASTPSDFGDAPAQYPTLLADNGARHKVTEGPYLGNVAPDVEADGQPSDNALGDDSNGTDDEDGVLTLLYATGGASVARVTVSGADGLLDGWIDFNQDGDWNDPGEQIFASQPVHVGTNDIPFIGMNTNPSGPVYARYRISTAGGLAPTGAAADGEVEDYILQPIVDPNDPTGTGNGGNNPGDPPVLPPRYDDGGAIPLATLAGLFLTLLWRRRM